MAAETYAQLCKKHTLPPFRELDDEFELCTIEHEDLFLRETVHKIISRVEAVVELLNNILQPDPASILGITECRFFEDGEREALAKLFAEMMAIKRSGESASLGSEDDAARFIRDGFKKWMSHKPALRSMLDKMAANWLKDDTAKIEIDYMR